MLLKLAQRGGMRERGHHGYAVADVPRKRVEDRPVIRSRPENGETHVRVEGGQALERLHQYTRALHPRP